MTKSILISRQREALLRFVALRDGRDYELVLREYRGIPQPGDDPKMISSGLYQAVEAAIAFMNAPEPEDHNDMWPELGAPR